jgi:hypothetical protein
MPVPVGAPKNNTKPYPLTKKKLRSNYVSPSRVASFSGMGEEDAEESTPVVLQRQSSRGHGGNHEPGAIDRVQVITMPGCSVLPADGVTETRNTCTLHARFRVTFHTALHRLI